jgi:DNA-binding MarR family transcriptional regulator
MEEILVRFRKAYWATVHSADPLRLRAWEERGVTLPQLRILFSLREQPGATTSVLATHLGLTMPTVSGQVDKLVRAGLVARGSSPEDRRIIPLRLTNEGQAIVGDIKEGNQVYLAELATALGDDLILITRALERLASAHAWLQSAGARDER